MNPRIVKIINSWDPVGLFPMAPQDEYSKEVKVIENLLVSNPNISIEELSGVIDKLFIDKFGEGTYVKNGKYFRRDNDN